MASARLPRFPRGPGYLDPRRIGSPFAWATTLLFVGVMVLWTIVTPAFRSADEPQHVNSVLRLVEGGGWPAPAHALMSPEVLRAKTLSGFSAEDGQRSSWGWETMVPGVRPDIAEGDLIYFAPYSLQQPTPPDERLPFSELTLTQDVDLSRYLDQMTQHPPLYYGVEAAVVHVAGADEWRFDRALALMRWVSVALVAPLPLFAWSVAVRLTGRRRIGDVASALPLAVPQLAAFGGSVNNDALVFGLGGLLVVLMARLLTGDGSWRTSTSIGLVLGLALLTKGTLLIAIPVVGVAVLVAGRRTLSWRWPQLLVRLGAVWGVAFAVGGWWWALNWVRYGTVQPSGWNAEYAADLVVEGPRDSVVEFAVPFAARVATSFWGKFGWLELALPAPLVLALTVLLLGCVLLAFRRQEAGHRGSLIVLLSVSALMLVLLFQQLYATHLSNGQYGGMQGRYLFGGLVGLLAAAAIGIGTLVRPGGRAERWLPVEVLVLTGGVALYGLWFGFRGYYLEIGWSAGAAWQRMVDWSPWPEWLILTAFVGVAGAAALAVGAGAVSALRPTVPPDVAGPAGPVAATVRTNTGDDRVADTAWIPVAQATSRRPPRAAGAWPGRG
jgi:4-amino-4-deoxy-L-arabinose transferase-like glycosyltransferase